MTSVSNSDFHTTFKRWRQFRKMSQLELALTADISQRHISYLETGRSHPSRDMVMRLADAMNVPLRGRNLLLQSAGFTGEYLESQLDEPHMSPVMAAINSVLEHHDPLPAVLVDRFWEVRKTNRSAERFFSFVREATGRQSNETINLALMTLHPEGLRDHIVNWDQVAPMFVSRLRSEATSSGDPEIQQRLNYYLTLVDVPEDSVFKQQELLPVLPLKIRLGANQLSLFSVISTFGTPQDVTTDELRMEAFYPADEETSEFFRLLNSDD